MAGRLDGAEEPGVAGALASQGPTPTHVSSFEMLFSRSRYRGLCHGAITSNSPVRGTGEFDVMADATTTSARRESPC